MPSLHPGFFFEVQIIMLQGSNWFVCYMEEKRLMGFTPVSRLQHFG